MSATEAANSWKALLRILNERLQTLRHSGFYDAALDRYHPLRDQVITAFHCARLPERQFNVIFDTVPRLPDIEALRAEVAAMPLDALSVHFGVWFSAERWGVHTVHEVFQAGILTAALDRFSDPAAQLPFATYDTAKIEQMTEAVNADLTAEHPRFDGSL